MAECTCGVHRSSNARSPRTNAGGYGMPTWRHRCLNQDIDGSCTHFWLQVRLQMSASQAPAAQAGSRKVRRLTVVRSLNVTHAEARRASTLMRKRNDQRTNEHNMYIYRRKSVVPNYRSTRDCINRECMYVCNAGLSAAECYSTAVKQSGPNACRFRPPISPRT